MILTHLSSLRSTWSRSTSGSRISLKKKVHKGQMCHYDHSYYMYVIRSLKALFTIICTALQRQNYEQTEKENCFYLLSIIFLSTNSLRKYRAFSHNVMVAILVFQNSDMAAMLVFQTNPMGVGLFFHANNFFLFPQICIDADHASENALYREQSEEFVCRYYGLLLLLFV